MHTPKHTTVQPTSQANKQASPSNPTTNEATKPPNIQPTKQRTRKQPINNSTHVPLDQPNQSNPNKLNRTRTRTNAPTNATPTPKPPRSQAVGNASTTNLTSFWRTPLALRQNMHKIEALHFQATTATVSTSTSGGCSRIVAGLHFNAGPLGQPQIQVVHGGPSRNSHTQPRN